ncbi:MAG: hypothetical protein IJC39_00455 [Firmicutes bacterium]|nr:hypothetical protein [Bacillota bacterium]
MKRYLEGDNLVSAVRGAILDLRDREDKRMFYVFMGIVIAVMVFGVFIVIWAIRKKKNNEYEAEWDDDDWAEFDEDCCCHGGHHEDSCCCHDDDVESDVKVENI